jgi:hypothetical protein
MQNQQSSSSQNPQTQPNTPFPVGETIELNLALLRLDENARFIRSDKVDSIADRLRHNDQSSLYRLLVQKKPNPVFDESRAESLTNSRIIYDLLNGHHRVLAAQKIGKLTWPCLVYSDLSSIQIAQLKVNDNNETPSTDPERLLILHFAIMEFVSAHQRDTPEWIESGFTKKIIDSKIVEQIIPPSKVAEGSNAKGRATTNWQNIWIVLSCFGFRKSVTVAQNSKKKEKPKGKVQNLAKGSKVFASPSHLKELLLLDLNELQEGQETITTVAQKRHLSQMFLNIFTKRTSDILAMGKPLATKIMAALSIQLMRVHRFTRIQGIIGDLGLFVNRMEDVAIEDEEEQQTIKDETIRYLKLTLTISYLNSLSNTIAVTNWLVEELTDAGVEGWSRQHVAIIKNLLMWSPLDFWFFFFGPLNGSLLWSAYEVKFLPTANLSPFRHDSNAGTVQSPPNVVLRNRIKTKILEPTIQAEVIGNHVLDYLTFIFTETRRVAVDALHNFEYLVYSKSYGGSFNPTHEGFLDEVTMSCMNQEDRKSVV